MSDLLEQILVSRGVSAEAKKQFLHPDYLATKHDPFLLPDMQLAVKRLEQAASSNEEVVIYGDYDIDGLTATTLLLDAFTSFGIKARAFIPNRFVEGYGLSSEAIERLADDGASLIVTVDCGSLSHKEIELANSRGVDVIVTDHHSVAETMPAAVATINPKRPDHNYPFIDLAGVGVAFKLVQAMQTKLPGLPQGHEKWLLDLVALGTVCDVVTLLDENRTNVFWGLQVMQKTRRPGIRALMAVSRVQPGQVNARALGFGLGPRLNASGRLETARLSLDLLLEQDETKALELAEKLDVMNQQRRTEQDRIFKEAIIKAEKLADDPVLIVSDPSWSHGIIGIVAAKLLEKYKKPTFVLQEMENGVAKGSARSYGDFSAVGAIRATDHLLIKGGGHKLAAGVTIEAKNIDTWRKAVNDFYRERITSDQLRHLDPPSDIVMTDFKQWSVDSVRTIEQLEPFGNGNSEPVIVLENAIVQAVKLMGAEQQHAKLTVIDQTGDKRSVVCFSAPDHVRSVQPGERATMHIVMTVNEWRGNVNAEGRLLKLQTEV